MTADLPPAPKEATMDDDLTIDNQSGTKVQRRKVGYYPADHARHPGVKDSWVILATVPGARGPFTETRKVTTTRWESAS